MATPFEKFLFGTGNADIDKYQQGAMDELDKAKTEILALYPEREAEYKAYFDKLIDLVGQQGEKMKGELQKQISVGQIKTREDLNRFFGGAVDLGRTAGAITKGGLEQQQKLADLLGGIGQEQTRIGLEKIKALTGLSQEKAGLLAQLAGQRAGTMGQFAQLKAQQPGTPGFLQSLLPALVGQGKGALSLLFPGTYGG